MLFHVSWWCGQTRKHTLVGNILPRMDLNILLAFAQVLKHCLHISSRKNYVFHITFAWAAIIKCTKTHRIWTEFVHGNQVKLIMFDRYCDHVWMNTKSNRIAFTVRHSDLVSSSEVIRCCSSYTRGMTSCICREGGDMSLDRRVEPLGRECNSIGLFIHLNITRVQSKTWKPQDMSLSKW